MTIVYVLAALLVIAAIIFFLPIASPTRVIPRKPEPRPDGIEWKVDFRLFFPSRKDGYFVQHIRIHEQVTTCDDAQFAAPVADRKVEFWEAWPVRAGTLRPEAPPPPAPAQVSDDAFRFGIPFPDLGMHNQGRVRIEVRAEVRFYPGVVLPATFIRNNPATQAGHALSDTTRPPFLIPGGTQHDFIAEWENCGAAEMHWKRLDEIPKFKE